MGVIGENIAELAGYLRGEWLQELQGPKVSWGEPGAWVASLGAEVITVWIGELPNNLEPGDKTTDDLGVILDYLDKCLAEGRSHGDGGIAKLEALNTIQGAREAVSAYLKIEGRGL